MISKPLFVLTILGLLSSVQAASTFVGCVLSATVALTASNGARVASQAACNTRCLAANQQYSYYTNAVLIGNNCYCDALGSYAAATNYLVGSSANPSSCLDAVQATATDLKTTFSFQGCTNTLTGVVIDLTQGTILGGALVQDPQACFERCKSNLQAYFIPIVPSLTAIAPTFGCVCDPSGPGASGVCGIGQFYKYTHSATASQNAQSRKREMQRVAEAERRKSFCPKKMTSCVIPGVEDSWECVDPESDLESCGGCTHGEYTAFGPVNSTSTGLDCTNMPGVLMGGSTCTNGKCVAFACKRKWTLRDGECVR
ncbi:uncharacterized protein IL334_002094 [Kwoniella shivajii]|uniref:Protein CPL1-like domain-containing protein n=1 Tax=Kwoniella shivajii TaxID=564305 RepID=A0ABZ1CTQ9_9TREE|nr:hypothetical protein IL334_002094 [Kwoniella shivajii]